MTPLEDIYSFAFAAMHMRGWAVGYLHMVLRAQKVIVYALDATQWQRYRVG